MLNSIKNYLLIGLIIFSFNSCSNPLNVHSSYLSFEKGNHQFLFASGSETKFERNQTKVTWSDNVEISIKDFDDYLENSNSLDDYSGNLDATITTSKYTSKGANANITHIKRGKESEKGFEYLFKFNFFDKVVKNGKFSMKLNRAHAPISVEEIKTDDYFLKFTHNNKETKISGKCSSKKSSDDMIITWIDTETLSKGQAILLNFNPMFNKSVSAKDHKGSSSMLLMLNNFKNKEKILGKAISFEKIILNNQKIITDSLGYYNQPYKLNYIFLNNNVKGSFNGKVYRTEKYQNLDSLDSFFAIQENKNWNFFNYNAKYNKLDHHIEAIWTDISKTKTASLLVYNLNDKISETTTLSNYHEKFNIKIKTNKYNSSNKAYAKVVNIQKIDSLSNHKTEAFTIRMKFVDHHISGEFTVKVTKKVPHLADSFLSFKYNDVNFFSSNKESTSYLFGNEIKQKWKKQLAEVTVEGFENSISSINPEDYPTYPITIKTPNYTASPSAMAKVLSINETNSDVSNRKAYFVVFEFSDLDKNIKNGKFSVKAYQKEDF